MRNDGMERLRCRRFDMSGGFSTFDAVPFRVRCPGTPINVAPCMGFKPSQMFAIAGGDWHKACI
jgi:hypothetical protein